MVSEAYGGTSEVYLKYATMAPKHDPAPLAAIMAAATSKMGIVATMSTTFYPPFLLARLCSTLDSIAEGRFGWNIVTSGEDGSAQNFGMDKLTEHDLRYDIADEYLDLVCQLWESWEPDAVIRDRETNTYADFKKVHAIHFAGKYFKSRGPLNTVRAPQGRPSFVQAGGSPKGRQFASKYADSIIAVANGVEGMKAYRDDVRARAAAQGRNPDDIKVLFVVSPTLGSTEEEARARKRNFVESDQFFGLIHAYHRVFYEHRGIFHQLGYGHSGKVGPEFAPVLEGSGRAKHITSWSLYDRHYGPLFDGTAFSASRRGPRPIPFVYLPINPEWPASYEFWGERGYEAEFVNVVSEMERHFREKGWTHTTFEVFFNHKKRYKGFPWDGDEVRFPKDLKYFLEYDRLLKKALPLNTPVHFVFRADVSWDMEEQFKVLNGIVRLWCCGGGILSFYRHAPKMLCDRGDVVWYYGGPPGVTDSSSAITEFPLRAWLWGVNGYVHWLTVSPGEDPWFHFDGGQTALIYSGKRFGDSEPIPSIRLKIQRNCLAQELRRSSVSLEASLPVRSTNHIPTLPHRLDLPMLREIVRQCLPVPTVSSTKVTSSITLPTHGQVS